MASYIYTWFWYTAPPFVWGSKKESVFFFFWCTLGGGDSPACVFARVQRWTDRAKVNETQQIQCHERLLKEETRNKSYVEPAVCVPTRANEWPGVYFEPSTLSDSRTAAVQQFHDGGWVLVRVHHALPTLAVPCGALPCPAFHLHTLWRMLGQLLLPAWVSYRRYWVHDTSLIPRNTAVAAADSCSSVYTYCVSLYLVYYCCSAFEVSGLLTCVCCACRIQYDGMALHCPLSFYSITLYILQVPRISAVWQFCDQTRTCTYVVSL